MTTSQQARALAEELQARRLAASPFTATYMGLPGHDDRVPDVSRDGEAAHRAAAASFLERAQTLADGPDLEPADAVTLETVAHTARSDIADLDAGLIEHTISPQGDGPSLLMQMAGVTTLTGPAAAADYLTRCRAMAGYVDACADRLREGAAAGRLPVAALVTRTLAQLDGYLGSDLADDPLTGLDAPQGWDGETAWRAEVTDAVRDLVRPAVARYRDLAAELAPRSRGDDRPGLVHLPGGREAYDRLVLVHTSLPLTAEEVHTRGLAAVAELREQMTEVGARIGLHGFEAARDGVRGSSAGVDPHEALVAAQESVRRAEGALGGWFAEPLPPACRVEPMSTHLGQAGVPPHYTPPTDDGSRPGTYWFNVDQVGMGAAWDREAVAYHEAVPGHHLQLQRMLTRADLPTLQRQAVVTVHAEGWGLYAELLAEEMGLYSDDRQRLGALGARIFRATRLVVDTGLHALGWSRAQALETMLAHVPAPEAFLSSEVDRYVAWPGQALAYYTGFEEILRLRARAREELGDRFDIAGFHAAVLDGGCVPLPALRRAVTAWTATART